ncbi:Septin [Wallemia mellicola]|uniref:Nascent polypeptide-associated complex subunit beta n=1 Tax=Wallemia mellicola TaxID=1708541 RepID=A0A4T0Q8F8_9BASI|nr:Septin [Wallemia mellicola]TIC65197.1 Septin [Wallemia mellicola]
MSIEEIQENVENLNFSEAGPSNAGTQSRAEKKARQALQGLGLKKVQGVTRVVLRRPRNVMLVASNPEVHTAPGSGIHIVFGEFKVEDPSQIQAASQLADQEGQEKTESKKPEEIMAEMDSQAQNISEGKGKDVEEEGEVDETGVDAKDIELVIAQVGCSRAKAVKVLKENNAKLKRSVLSALRPTSLWYKVFQKQNLLVYLICQTNAIRSVSCQVILHKNAYKVVAKRGGHFTIMVVGESGLGKSTLINTLFSTELSAKKDYRRRHAKQLDKTTEIEIIKAELEEKQFKVKLTVIDTPGFGDYVNNRDSWSPIIDFVDDQHESYMRQEQQPNRQEKSDMRVHACLYFVRPTGHTLKPLDIEIMKRLGTRVNLVPVIAKADTLTQSDLQSFKKRILEVIEAQGIKIYKPPVESDDEGNQQHVQDLIDSLPFSIIGSTEDVKNSEGKQSQMETRKFGEPKPKKLDNPKFKEEEESLRKRFTEQVKLEEDKVDPKINTSDRLECN